MTSHEKTMAINNQWEIDRGKTRQKLIKDMVFFIRTNMFLPENDCLGKLQKMIDDYTLLSQLPQPTLSEEELLKIIVSSELFNHAMKDPSLDVGHVIGANKLASALSGRIAKQTLGEEEINQIIRNHFSTVFQKPDLMKAIIQAGNEASKDTSSHLNNENSEMGVLPEPTSRLNNGETLEIRCKNCIHYETGDCDCEEHSKFVSKLGEKGKSNTGKEGR